MILIKDDISDFTPEGYTTLATMMSLVYAGEILAYRVADSIAAMGVGNSIFHQRKKALNTARRQMQSAITNLETAFDGDFDDIVFGGPVEGAANRDKEFHALAAETLKLALIFMAVSEGMEYGKRQNIFKMMMNFKGGPASEKINLSALLTYFKFDG